MTRCLAPLASLLGLLLLTGLAVAASNRHMHGGPVYSIAALRIHLEDDPQAWVGRTVVVRAIAEPCPFYGSLSRLLLCADQELVLVGAPAEAPAAPLPLVQTAPHPLRSVLRLLPILGDLLPRPQMTPLFAPARFRVRLLVLPTDACAGCLPSYVAQWLDAAPGAPDEG